MIANAVATQIAVLVSPPVCRYTIYRHVLNSMNSPQA
jgi:hypothetical protein